MPKAGPARPLQLPTPEPFTLPNGLTVILSERTRAADGLGEPGVRDRQRRQPADKPGLANFTAAMLDEGTATRNALQIADEVARLGGVARPPELDDGRDAGRRRRSLAAAVSARARPGGRRRAAIRRSRRRRSSGSAPAGSASWCSSASNPARRVARDGRGALRPGASVRLHRARHRGVEQGDDRDDVQAFWKQNFVPNNAALVVAGDISMTRARGAGREGVRRLAGQARRRGTRCGAARRPTRARGDRRQARGAADAGARRQHRRAARRRPTTRRSR